MKKLMFAIAAVAAGTVLADVTSANIVGYATRTTPQGEFRLLSVPWNTVSGDSACINDVFPCTSAGVLDWSQTRSGNILAPVKNTSPQIQIQVVSDDPSKDGGYETYYYVSNAKVAEGPDKKHPITEPGWCNESCWKATPDQATLKGVIPVTGAFWVKSGPTGEAFTITFNP